MNKLIKLLALTASILPGLAYAGNTAQPNQTNIVADQEQRFAIPADKLHGAPDINLKWSPDALKTVEYTVTVSTIVASGSGIVDGICVSSGAAGDYALLIDSNTIYPGTSATLGTLSTLVGSQQSGIGVIKEQRTMPFASSTSAVDGDNNAGCTEFFVGLPFSNGLYVAMSAANSRVVVRYRLLRRTGG